MSTNETPSVAAVAKALETTQHDHTDVAWPDTGWGRCTPGHLCGLCTAVALALDAYAREQAHWRCDLCHCCGEKRHDDDEPCVSCASTAREREAAVWEAAARCIRGNPLWAREDIARTFDARAAGERGKG